MNDELFLCYRCMCWHCKPRCDWDCEEECVECGARVGYPAAEQPRDPLVCNRCWLRSQGLLIPETAPETDHQDDRLADMFRERAE